MTPSLTPQAFVAKWRHVELKERSACQEHFIDLCHLVDHPTPVEADPTGASFAFEVGADKQQGGHGWADVWKKGFFGWEYKGKHANLDKAYDQLLQYRSDLQNPPLLIVCDMDRIIIHSNFTNSIHQTYTLTPDDLLTANGLKQLRAIFHAPDVFRVAQTAEQVTREAAREFAHLAELLRQYGTAPHEAAHFLIRCLFCLFAEDVSLLPDQVFTRIMTQARKQPRSFVPQVSQLFQTMATGGYFGAEEISYFNGRLFDNAAVFELDTDSLDILRRVSELDWSNIEPSIFGTLFTRSLDPARRAQLGAQYTSKEDILLILEPVLMAPLRRKWIEIQAQAHELAAQRQAASGTKKIKLDKQLRDLLIGFATELATISVLDPACGSGNFLYLALVLLLDLWKEVSNFMAELGFPRLMPTPDVSPSPLQLHGIEKDEYAHELARTTIWIGYIQWFVQNGFGFPPEPILRPIDTVVQMDAILTLTPLQLPPSNEKQKSSTGGESAAPSPENRGRAGVGAATEPEWPAVDVIVGNPPFLGGGKIRSELGDEYTEALFKLYGDRLPNFSDLVCYWFEKARAMIEQGKVKRAGLLATQAIRGGANREVLKRIKESGDIFWAQSDRDWILDDATVHVAMIGFNDGTNQSHLLDDQHVIAINSDLTSSIDITHAQKLEGNLGICFMGPSPKAPFDIEAELAAQMMQAKGNPNRRSNSDVVRPVASGIDLVGKARNKWTIDFALMSFEEAAMYEMPFEYAKKHVYPIRSKNRRASYAQRWWQYAEARPGMREALNKKPRFIATPEVSKHRIFVWVKPEYLCNQQTLVFARDDDYFFGALHSRVHELWARRMGTQLREAESGFRYTPTTTFETFPFPWPPGKEPSKTSEVLTDSQARPDDRSDRLAGKDTLPVKTSEVSLEQAIAAAAKELVQLRDTQLGDLTLTQLYNKRPTWLDNAHRKLDAAVFAAYGWPVDLSDDEILARLLALNLERAG